MKIGDGLGSVTALSHNGVVVERYQYDPYGITTVCDGSGSPLWPNQSTYGNRFMFTGRELDDETGLYYYRARMYEPQLGRFMQPDPIGYADGMNIYAYCGNNPVNWIDPWGLCATNSQGGKDHDLAETGKIMNGTKGLGYRWNPTQHDSGMKYDFMVYYPSKDRFAVMINGQKHWMSPSEFGNYLAGYASTYNLGLGGYLGVRAFGNSIATNGASYFTGDDWQSIRDINYGRNEGFKARVWDEVWGCWRWVWIFW